MKQLLNNNYADGTQLWINLDQQGEYCIGYLGNGIASKIYWENLNKLSNKEIEEFINNNNLNIAF